MWNLFEEDARGEEPHICHPRLTFRREGGCIVRSSVTLTQRGLGSQLKIQSLLKSITQITQLLLKSITQKVLKVFVDKVFRLDRIE